MTCVRVGGGRTECVREGWGRTLKGYERDQTRDKWTPGSVQQDKLATKLKLPIMLWRASLAVALLCVGSICNCEQTALVSRVVLPREYRLKLCGREFIRSIIITCGGSQSRRSTQLGE